MSRLSVYPLSTPSVPNKVLSHFEDIASTLAEVGVRFQREPLEQMAPPGAPAEELLVIARARIDAQVREHGYPQYEVLSLEQRRSPQAPPAKLLAEHWHDAGMACLVLAGRVLINLRIGDCLYAVLCERGDLLAVPGGIRQWLDLGTEPRLAAVRLFHQAAHATGEPLPGVPGLDD